MNDSYLENQAEIEYISLEEAMEATGMSAKTLKNRLRGKVPKIGKSGWFRRDFFQYWRDEHLRNGRQKRNKAVREAIQQSKNILAKGENGDTMSSDMGTAQQGGLHGK